MQTADLDDAVPEYTLEELECILIRTKSLLDYLNNVNSARAICPSDKFGDDMTVWIFNSTINLIAAIEQQIKLKQLH